MSIVIQDLETELMSYQQTLNVRIGVDLQDQSNKDVYWAYNMLQALSDELMEARNCLNWKWWSKEGKEGIYTKIIDYENLKLELIDCLHFVLSLQLLINSKYEDDHHGLVSAFESDPERRIWNIADNLDFILTLVQRLKTDISMHYSYALEMRHVDLTPQLITELKYIINICWSSIIGHFESSFTSNLDEIRSIYLMKNKANLKRQDDGYSVVTKTEADNNEIKEEIRKKEMAKGMMDYLTSKDYFED